MIFTQAFLEKAHTYGPAKGSVVEIDELLAQYYEAGWDNQGVPTTQTLNKLGVIDAFHQILVLSAGKRRRIEEHCLPISSH